MKRPKPVIDQTHEELDEAQFREWARMSGQERVALVLFLSRLNARNFQALQPGFWEGDFVLKRRQK